MAKEEEKEEEEDNEKKEKEKENGGCVEEGGTGGGGGDRGGAPPCAGCEIYLQTGSASMGLKRLPRRQHVERSILLSLQDRPREFEQAVMRLPKNSLSLYVHAAQSLVWNHVVAARIRQFGTRPMPGDLYRYPDSVATPGTAAAAAHGRRQRDAGRCTCVHAYSRDDR
eukprot:GHVU01160918.1.p1 GENE.GHVU01160918.1~~GHVU01160918.1.p1  ORF type:complete len:180 (-),score=37.45 GHVU01160918.1:715-1218(-)